MLRGRRAHSPLIVAVGSLEDEVTRLIPSRFQSLFGSPSTTAVAPVRTHSRSSLAFVSPLVSVGSRNSGETNQSFVCGGVLSGATYERLTGKPISESSRYAAL